MRPEVAAAEVLGDRSQAGSQVGPRGPASRTPAGGRHRTGGPRAGRFQILLASFSHPSFRLHGYALSLAPQSLRKMWRGSGKRCQALETAAGLPTNSRGTPPCSWACSAAAAAKGKRPSLCLTNDEAFLLVPVTVKLDEVQLIKKQGRILSVGSDDFSQMHTACDGLCDLPAPLGPEQVVFPGPSPPPAPLGCHSPAPSHQT